MNKRHSYLKVGSGEKTLFFFHGFLGNRKTWKEVMMGLSRDYQCIAIDLPFHGEGVILTDRSWRSLGDSYLWEKYLEATEEIIGDIIEEERVAQYAFIGYSMGARVAMGLTLYGGLKPYSLILESFSVGIPSKGRKNRFDQDQALQCRMLSNRPLDFLNQWYSQTIFQGIKSKGAYKQLLASMDEGNMEVISWALPYISQSLMPMMFEDISKIKYPVLLLGGAMDLKYRSILEKLHSVFVDSELKYIGDASHNTHWMEPQKYLKELKSFLARKDRYVSK